MSTGESGQKSGESKNSPSMGMPAAIVLAGGLIALAIYFGSSKAPVPGNTNNNGLIAAASDQPNLPDQPTQPTIGDIRPVTDKDHVRGAANAKITIIEYSDTECPFCKDFHNTMKKVVAAYPNDVRWVYRHSPIPQLHSKASDEANATECASEQGKFWEFTDLVYETTPSNDGLDLTKLPSLAKQAGVANVAQFEQCVKDKKFAQRVSDDVADAEAAGGRGTPYSVIVTADGSKQAINGAQAFEQVKSTIDTQLKK